MLYVHVFQQICLCFIPLLSEISFCRMCTELKKCHHNLNKVVADGCITTASMYYLCIINNVYPTPNNTLGTGLGCELLLYRVTYGNICLYAFPHRKRFYQYDYM